jgi:RNA polymerase sigma-70 factor (ECF subfamily)
MERHREFEENIRNHRNYLISFIASKINRHSDVEDIFQKACVTIWKNYDKFDKTTNFTTWACTFALNELRNNIRVYNRNPVSFNSEEYDNVCVFLKTEYKQNSDEIHDKLIDSLNKLNDESRELLICVYVNGEESKQLAKRLGKSPQTIYNKINTAKNKLKEIISEYEKNKN